MPEGKTFLLGSYYAASMHKAPITSELVARRGSSAKACSIGGWTNNTILLIDKVPATLSTLTYLLPPIFIPFQLTLSDQVLNQQRCNNNKEKLVYIAYIHSISINMYIHAYIHTCMHSSIVLIDESYLVCTTDLGWPRHGHVDFLSYRHASP